ncbi:MAG: SIR2 family protein [Dehalococcoidia bacterium]|nr:SIR2 family protein [Dehalococcoidia bacterium]
MTTEQSQFLDALEEGARPKRVVYLLGAGATQGCVSHRGSKRSLVMAGLQEPISTRIRADLDQTERMPGVARLVNDVLDESTDVEHLLTFLDESPSQSYRAFADALRHTFSTVLREQLDAARNELSPHHSALYAALIDMHEIPGLNEHLSGFLTLNYDVFLEHAITDRHSKAVDYGVSIHTLAQPTNPSIPVLKLHGSFGWVRDWPITAALDHDGGFWIPPGIRKPKNEYPFNVIWGRARELLDCDILRVIGCNLGPNDWDLISLIFTTQHLHSSAMPYIVEIIASLGTASSIARMFPYLGVHSLIDIPDIGDEVISEALAISRDEYSSLTDMKRADADLAIDARMRNPFAYWLRQKGEVLLRQNATVATASGIFQDFMDAEV